MHRIFALIGEGVGRGAAARMAAATVVDDDFEFENGVAHVFHGISLIAAACNKAHAGKQHEQ